jgi:hypothetical protein
VTAFKDVSGAYRLVGYVAPGDVDLTATDTFLRGKLLPAMVPSQLVALEQMPRLPNGKIDVKSLEEPAWGPAAAAAADGESAPAAVAKTPLELLMAEAWAEVLHLPLERVDVNANFFQMGGSSLRAGLINSKIRRVTEFDISGMLIYKHPTIFSMCAAIERDFGSYPSDDDCGSAIGAGVYADSGFSSNTSSFSSRYPGCSTSPSAADMAIRLPSIRLPSGSGGSASGFGKSLGAETAAVPYRGLPGWLSSLLQILPLSALGVFTYALALPSLLLGHFLWGVVQIPLWVLPLFASGLAVSAFAIALVFVVFWKWILLGKQRPGRHAIWSWYYIRW